VRGETTVGAKTRFLVATLVLALVVGGCGAAAISLHQNLPRAAATGSECSPLIPANKCNPTVPPGTTVPGTTVPPPAPGTGSAATKLTTTCGPTFFTSTERSTLTTRFGLLTCFRFDQSDQWVVFGDGMTVTKGSPDTAAPGGAMVAVLKCSTSDSACSNTDVTHSFTSFQVSYPPDPSSGRSNLGAVEADGVLLIENGHCSMFDFDLNTLNWYPGTASDTQSIAVGNIPAAISVPPQTTGATAVSEPAPTATGDCPSYAG
jgi:hypothetical protein